MLTVQSGTLGCRPRPRFGCDPTDVRALLAGTALHLASDGHARGTGGQRNAIEHEVTGVGCMIAVISVLVFGRGCLSPLRNRAPDFSGAQYG